VRCGAIEAVIEENARLLGEAPTIGVHYLKDGRVRIFDLDRGWRRSGFAEYSSAERALAAARVANGRARKVNRLLKSGIGLTAAIWRTRP